VQSAREYQLPTELFSERKFHGPSPPSGGPKEPSQSTGPWWTGSITLHRLLIVAFRLGFDGQEWIRMREWRPLTAWPRHAVA
jgi:hypothetical protein